MYGKYSKFSVQWQKKKKKTHRYPMLCVFLTCLWIFVYVHYWFGGCTVNSTSDLAHCTFRHSDWPSWRCVSSKPRTTRSTPKVLVVSWSPSFCKNLMGEQDLDILRLLHICGWNAMLHLVSHLARACTNVDPGVDLHIFLVSYWSIHDTIFSKESSLRVGPGC